MFNLTKEELNNAYESFYHDTEKYAYKVIIQRKSFQSNSTKVKQRTIQRRITNTTMFLYMYLKMVLCLLITITNEKTLTYTQK